MGGRPDYFCHVGARYGFRDRDTLLNPEYRTQGESIHPWGFAACVYGYG